MTPEQQKVYSYFDMPLSETANSDAKKTYQGVAEQLVNLEWDLQLLARPASLPDATLLSRTTTPDSRLQWRFLPILPKSISSNFTTDLQ